MASVADFEASRHEALTQRMRSAKVSGHVPQWQTAMTFMDAPDNETNVVPRPVSPAAPKAPAPARPHVPTLEFVMSVLLLLALVAVLGGVVWRREHQKRYNA